MTIFAASVSVSQSIYSERSPSKPPDTTPCVWFWVNSLGPFLPWIKVGTLKLIWYRGFRSKIYICRGIHYITHQSYLKGSTETWGKALDREYRWSRIDKRKKRRCFDLSREGTASTSLNVWSVFQIIMRRLLIVLVQIKCIIQSILLLRGENWH